MTFFSFFPNWTSVVDETFPIIGNIIDMQLFVCSWAELRFADWWFHIGVIYSVSAELWTRPKEDNCLVLLMLLTLLSSIIIIIVKLFINTQGWFCQRLVVLFHFLICIDTLKKLSETVNMCIKHFCLYVLYLCLCFSWLWEWRLALTTGPLRWFTSPFITVSGSVLWTWSRLAGNANRDLDHFYLPCLLPHALGCDVHKIAGPSSGEPQSSSLENRMYRTGNVTYSDLFKWFHDLATDGLESTVWYLHSVY